MDNIIYLKSYNIDENFLYRKRCNDVRFSDLESEFEDCDLEDAAALETKLRKVARTNSLTHDEMMKLLHVHKHIHKKS